MALTITPERAAALAAFQAENVLSPYTLSFGVKPCEGHILVCSECGVENVYGCGDEVCECGWAGTLDEPTA